MSKHRDVFGNIIERPIVTEPQRYNLEAAEAALGVSRAYAKPGPKERQAEVTSDELLPPTATEQDAVDAYWAATTPAEETAAMARLKEFRGPPEDDWRGWTEEIPPMPQSFFIPTGGIGDMGPNMQEYDGPVPHMPEFNEIRTMELQHEPLPPNPKQIFGDAKVPLHLVPSAGVIHEAQAFKEGARKYGPYNWRLNAVEGMTYIGAALRHIYTYLDGEDYDPEVGDLVHHLGEARASLGIILDALATGNLIDNRPIRGSAMHLLAALKKEQGR